jgi:hypothetical protein
MNKYILFLFAFTCISSGIFGQKAPVKFGDVSIDELQMATYPADTSAPAVILYDYGHFNSSSFLFTRVRRIKILKKDGYSWANSSYQYNSDTEVKGITFNLENGKVIKDNLKNESIYKDKVSANFYVVRIAMPNIKVGSVIDLQFSFKGIMPVWRFQDEIPVKYSELEMEKSPRFSLKHNFYGYEPLAITTPTRWVAKDMPSFNVEPFMTSIENYITKLEFDILNIDDLYITSTWEEIGTLLRKNPDFGQALIGSTYLNALAKEIENKHVIGEEKLKRAYDALKSAVKWNEKESLLASNSSLGFVYRMKIGNSADVNLILLQLLKKLEIDADPVVISTRDNGYLSPLSPSIQKLNYVIVQAKIDGKTYLLDATEPSMPYYLIPFRCLNNSGRLIKQISSEEVTNEEVTLGTSYKQKEFETYHLRLNEDNSLEGKLYIKSVDYAALDFRKKYRTFSGLDEYLEDFKYDKQGLQLIEPVINNIDSIYMPVIEDYGVRINDQANLIGNEIYIIPMLYHQFKENPFRTDDRKYPVDYGHNIEHTITSSFEIPANYEVYQLPAAVNLKLPDNSVSLIYVVTQSANTINVKSIFSINKTMFLFTEYPKLKEEMR